MRSRLPQRSARVDIAALREAVGAVEDPEIHQSLAELGMLRSASADRHGIAHVEVALTTPGCPMREQLHEQITSAAAAVAGVTAVELSFTTLPERERMALAQRLRGQQSSADPTGRLTGNPSVYAVASGKGGVGKSAVAANLAVALAQRGRRVGLLDADVWGHSVPQLFGIHRSPVALKGLMLPIEAHGVRLMSTGFFVDETEPVVWRGPMLHKALEQFLTDVHWGELDVMLLDLPPGTGDITLSLLELLPQAALLAVTTPQPAAQQVAYRVGRMAADMRMPIAGVVENMSTLVCAGCGEHTALFGTGGGQKLADDIDTELLSHIPLDIALRHACDAGVPLVAQHPETPAARALTTLAGRLPTARPSIAGKPLPLSVVG